ncbi:hypothetical protein B296_00048239 [Ensete ventricosum]|uniref:Uncharacterized protein n=1 Tax=Ensete ventricosum TaxID=4639 RepID=A0A426Y3A7_ENSVE|nr:hypothetical protein B296_00048239 [Ensete ventricosum]
MQWNLARSSLEDSPKGSETHGNTLGDRSKKTIRLGTRMSEAAGFVGIQEVVPPKVPKSVICDFLDFLAVVSPWWSQNPGLCLVVVPPVLVVVSPIPQNFGMIKFLAPNFEANWGL